MTPSARAARRASAGGAVLCAALFAAGCGSQAAPTAGPLHPPAGPSNGGPSAGITGSPLPTPAACTTADLKVTVDSTPGGAAAGSTYYPLNFTNSSSQSCSLFGYPGVSFVTGQGGAEIGPAATRNPALTPAIVMLAPGAIAHVSLQVVDAANYGSACKPVTANWLRVYPPGQTGALYVKLTAQVCSASLPSNAGSPLSVDALRGGAGRPGSNL